MLQNDTDALIHASEDALGEALLQRDDPELATCAACEVGDRLRFGQITALSPTLRDALIAAQGATAAWTDLRFEATIALCEAKDAAGEAMLAALSLPRRRFDAIKALSRLPGEKVRAAIGRLARRVFLPWPDRLAASAAAMVMGDAEGARYVEKRLASRAFPMRRRMALHLLGELRHPQAFEILSAILESRDAGVEDRATAIRAIGYLRDARAVPYLKNYLHKLGPGDALGGQGSGSASTQLLEAEVQDALALLGARPIAAGQ